jgi:penicillin-binding protein 2
MFEESPGLMPSREWKRATRRQAWFPGETLILGIGQGYMQATPLQLAQATALVANKGVWKPSAPGPHHRRRKAGG